jgi:transposase-like protein
MPPRLEPAKREAILDDIRTAGETGESRNTIARRCGVSPSTVSKIAEEAGLAGAFDRTQTENATRAKLADNRAVRADLSRRLLAKAGDLLDQMDEPHRAFAFGGKDNVYREHELPRPPAGDLRNLMVTAATAIDKHLALDRHDSGAGLDETVSLLDRIWDGLKAKHGDGPDEDASAGGDGTDG